MANTIVRGQMIFQDENALAHPKKAVARGKAKSSLGAPKKNGVGFGSRKALHDITNKSNFQPQASSKTKKNVEGVDFDIAKEGFLHDHNKCIDQQQYHWDSCFMDMIPMLRKRFLNTIFKRTKMDDKSGNTWDELNEIPLEECSTQWRSPPDSPIHYHSSLPPEFQFYLVLIFDVGNISVTF